MQSIRTIFLLSLLALGAASCTKEKTDAPGGDPTGVWQWVRSDGGLGNHIHDTPASTGKQITLKLTADGRYTFYSNGSPTAEGTYTLEKASCIHDGKQKTLINFSGCADQMIHLLDASTLQLSDEAHDGIGSQYRRSEMSIYGSK